MQNKMLQMKTVKYWKDRNAIFMVNEHGQMHILGANLIKHALEIPYTKKDGTHVSKEMIMEMKQNPKNQKNSIPMNKPAMKRAY